MQHHTIIIGAGQAGLTAGYYLLRKVRPLLILEASNEVGTSWKERYDSLVLLTPAKYNALPKFNFPLSDNQHPSKNDMALYLKHYAGFINLPVHKKQKVKLLKRQNGEFWIESDVNSYLAENVVVATGAHQVPFYPELPVQATDNVYQIHSNEYKNPGQIPQGKVLVIGSGNSASDIALDLMNTHEVTLSAKRKLRFRKLYFLGKSWLWWRQKTGLMHLSANNFIGKYYQNKKEPIYGFELKKQIDAGRINLKPAVKRMDGDEAIFSDKTGETYNAVVWATGFTTDYSWIDIPELFDAKGNLKHRKGVSNIPGLYFLGMEWQRSRSSSLIAGTARDAKYIIKKLLIRSSG
jgi:putative flavoprotein involved in K+ transport